MPSLTELTGLSSKVLQKTLNLEPRQHYAPDEPDNLVFVSPSVAIKDAELRHGGRDEIGAKEFLSRLIKKILESGDITLFQVPEITATHLGYGKKSQNKEGRPAITEEEAKYWMEMLDLKRFGHAAESSGIDFTPEDIQSHLSGLKVEEKGSFHLVMSILFIYFDKKVPSEERKATVGPNKISDFFVFWILPYLLNYSNRKVQEIIHHGKRTIGSEFSVSTVQVCAEGVIEDACQQMSGQGEDLLGVYKQILGARPMKEKYDLLADSTGLPIIFIPLQYQVTKMPAHIEELGSKETWQKLGDVTLLEQFLHKLVEDPDIQDDLFHALHGLKDRQGIDYGIVFPDQGTFRHFIDSIKETRPACLSQPTSIHCRGIKAERAVVTSDRTNITVCFSYVQGSDNKTIAQLFRAVGSHYLNHFTIIIMRGIICNGKDPVYKIGNLHPVSKAMKLVKQGGALKKISKTTKNGKGIHKYPLEFLDGRGLFTDVDFPVTYLKWEDEVKTVPIIAAKRLKPGYRFDEPVSVGFFTKNTANKYKSLPLRSVGVANSVRKVTRHEYRVVSMDGCAIAHISQSARKHGHSLIMALSDYCGKHKYNHSVAQNPLIMQTIIKHFVVAIVVAGLPLVYRRKPDPEDHEVQSGAESEEEDDEEEDDEEEEDDSDHKEGEGEDDEHAVHKIDIDYHNKASASQDLDDDQGYQTSGGSTSSISAAIKEGQPTEEELQNLAQDVTGFWKKLGRALGVSDNKLNEIDIDEKDRVYEQAYGMLCAWKELKADGATYAALRDALRRSYINKFDLIKKYCVWC